MPVEMKPLSVVPPYEEIRALIETEPRFIPFWEMFSHEPLLQFVYHEKCRFPVILSEDRIVIDPTTRAEVGGDKTNTKMPVDDYHPGIFSPMILKAVWLPLAKGTLFTTLASLSTCSLVKKSAEGQDVILFLIHPKSQDLYHDLLEKYAASVFDVSALSLSSFRTVLASIPNARGGFDPVMVKLSLDEVIQGASRVLTTRECGLSVANSRVLREKLEALACQGLDGPPLKMIEDPLAFVPKGYSCGMIYRVLPTFLNPKYPNERGLYAIPILSLYGVKNRGLLQRLVEVHGGTITNFLEDCILKPFTENYIELLYRYQTSIEGHGQNLLLLLDKDQHVISLIYRDMGGVNQLFNDREWALLPANCQKPEIFYFEKHLVDAAKALEDHFVRRGLYPLTKQLVKCTSFQVTDKAFLDWYEQCQENGFLKNWTKDNLDQDDHETQLLSCEFFRYGYVEYLFAAGFISYLREHQLAPEAKCQDMEAHFFDPESLPDGAIVAPCSNVPFFSKTILKSLPTYERNESTKQEADVFTDYVRP